jgi:tetratricopeptide (TPR) repeat protein
VAERALRIDPEHEEATLVLAILRRRRGELDEAREILEKLLERPGLRVDLRQRALHQLGLVLDRLGRYEEAYEALAEHGRLTLAQPVAKRLDPSVFPRRIEGYREALGDLPWSTWRGGQEGGRPAPVFLVGFPRSGTTMTEQVLAAHPAVESSDEKPMIPGVLKKLVELEPGLEMPVPRLLRMLDESQRQTLREEYWSQVSSLVGEPTAGCTFVDKLPLNLIDVPLINAIFPDARIILALRDPRDVCLSCFIQSFRLNHAMVHLLSLDSTVALYEQVMQLWLAMRDHMTLPVLEVRYEDTVRELETQARRLLEFLDVPWDEGVLEFHEAARERLISTPSAAAVTEPVHTRAISRWRNYAAAFEPHLPRLEPFVQVFGYE